MPCRDLVKLKTIKTKLCILAAAVGTQGVADVYIASNTKFIGFIHQSLIFKLG